MMASRMRVLGIVLMIGLLPLLAGCSEFWKTPAPTPTPTPPPDIPAKVVAARNAALVYLRQAYPDSAPPEAGNWMGQDTTPPGLTGVSSYQFTTNSWLMAIRTAVVSLDNTIHEIEVGNEDIGFRWTGKLDAAHAVVESNLDVAVEALVVRDIVLSHIRERYSDQAPADNLVWIGERITPEGSVGYESCQFSADDWTMTVDYELARPDQMVYRIELRDLGSGFAWRAKVDAEGTVQELRVAS